MQALLENQSVLVNQPGQKMVEIDQLLYCFDAEILRELVAEPENHSDKLVSKAFLKEVSEMYIQR